MLTQQTIDIVKAITPVVGDNAEKITCRFYQRMFNGNPEVLAYFNQAHQHAGTQQRALAGAICAYFTHIDDLGALGPAVDLIAHKHCSLGIQPEHYPIVGKHLLDAIGDVLGDAVTPQIVTAVVEAYGFLADVCIGREAEIYADQATQTGGWTGFRSFTIANVYDEGLGIKSITLSPTDGGELPNHLPGQYITVHCPAAQPPTSPRNYSISSKPGDSHYRITIKKETAAEPGGPDGIVSNHLHSTAVPGATLEIGPPCGTFTLDAATYDGKPAVFIAGGIGITPLLPMAQALAAARPTVPIRFIHAVRSNPLRVFASEVAALTTSGCDIQACWITEDGSLPDAPSGQLTRTLLQDCLPTNDANVYLCGPRGFMQHTASLLRELGVPDSHLHYECFGPLQAI